MNSHTAKVGVVLLNWNSGELTANCLRSLLKGSIPPWRIHVFDNGSTDGSAEFLEKDFPHVQVIRSPTNIGFAAANNRCAEILLRDGAEYVWILNNDTVVDHKCLEALWQALEQDKEIAAASGKIRFLQEPEILQYAGADWHPLFLRAVFRGAGERDVGQYDTPCDTGMLSGCCMFVRAEAWRRIGAFRENYFVYNEDTEWSLRATRMGFRLRYVPSAMVWHALSASMRSNYGLAAMRKAPPIQEYLQTRNSIFLNREHARSAAHLAISLTDNITRRLYRAMGLAILGRWRSSLAIMRGILDGFTQSYR